MAIVTLATEDDSSHVEKLLSLRELNPIEEFFWQSSSTFLEGVHVKELFEELGIEVYFAERPAQMTFPAEPWLSSRQAPVLIGSGSRRQKEGKG